jgi:hypothetical protein
MSSSQSSESYALPEPEAPSSEDEVHPPPDEESGSILNPRSGQRASASHDPQN